MPLTTSALTGLWFCTHYAMVTLVEYSRRALYSLKGVPKPTAERIQSKIEELAADRRSQATNVKMLKGYWCAPIGGPAQI